ncbi:MAG TPA: mechanosensitive ion channel family protein [Polyangiaceae bacterium]|nr:mechanosensitive ion channel family protein [Polyangiaceae bacterium]HMR75402.1 mechanosensitive ion channel family protein [Polyangiaceae bacterium]
MNTDALMTTIQTKGVEIGIKLLGAVIAYIAGRWLISVAISLMRRALTARQVDATVQRYLGNIVSVLLNIALVVALLGYFGIETTSFAAIFAAAGIAIGMAWSGLLANFAAGVFLVILRPIKVGDFVTAGGITGTVKEIGLFVTVMDTPDNVETYVGNNKLLGDNIQNYSANPYRRVDLEAQLDVSVDPKQAVALLKERLAKIPNVTTEPAPDVEVLRFTLSGPVLAVRPYTHTDHYWQVYFDTNVAIREVGAEAGYPAPKEQMALHKLSA